MTDQQSTISQTPPESVTGVQLAQGIGQQPAKGLWADAFSQVLRRPGAVFGLCWVGIVLFFALFAPVLASGHPLIMRTLDASGNVVETTSPLLNHLTATDILLMIGGVLVPIWLLLPNGVFGLARSRRAKIALAIAVQIGIAVVLAGVAESMFKGRDVATSWLKFRDGDYAEFKLALIVSSVAAILGLALPLVRRMPIRAVATFVGFSLSLGVLSQQWIPPIERYEYREMQAAGQIKATYTLIPFSPGQTSTLWYNTPPMKTIEKAEEHSYNPAGGNATFLLGADALGADVFSQMMHASRLSISIGLVSTSIAVFIGLVMGAIMGYFGGWVDMLLFRVLEVFMSVPVLFLLIVAAGVLPRSIYIMMVIIGMFTWTGVARFTRAEFMKLRNQDFVQSAKAVGLPLRAIMFKHMLPNGVTPVLVEASFMIASAILIEAILSFLGLGPVGQPSWGKLLNDATGEAGDFLWWLAIFPGGAIFLTVLSYNLIGEALRDAIDPKLRKARV